MKTQPIGIRFEQDEYDRIYAFAQRSGLTFSQVVRIGTLSYADPDYARNYQSLADIAADFNPETIELFFGQFLDDFKRACNKYVLIEDEPLWSLDPGRWSYDFAATAHKLALDNNLPVPQWTLNEKYVADEPQYAFDTNNPQFQEYLRQTTPRAFQWHNLYLGENILSRA